MPVETGEKSLEELTAGPHSLGQHPRAAFSIACRELADKAGLAITRAARCSTSWLEITSASRKPDNGQ
jgi:hypothetical protein